MSRRIPALVGVGALTAMSALAATTAADASPQHRHATTSTHAPKVHLQRAAATPAGSIAIFSRDDNTFQVVRDVNRAKAKKTAVLDLGESTVAASINPVGGKDALLCTTFSQIYTAKRLRTAPHLVGTPIDATKYTGEGGSDYNMYCYGTAVHGTFALVTADSQGLLQLIRKKGDWKIDKRVKFPGLNDAGEPHRRGWIDIRDKTTKATLFDSVVIAPKALPNGKFLALTADREGSDPADNAIVVVSGVGTANPKVRGVVESSSLLVSDVNFSSPDSGAGGMAFVPGTADRAVVLTKSGFAVLGLSDPANPRLKNRVKISAAVDTDFDPVSLTISRDGDHLAVAVGHRVYVYKNVLAATSHGKAFKKQGSFRLSSSTDDVVSDVAFTSNNTLLALHGPAGTTDGWALTVVKKVTAGRHVIKGSTNTIAPDSQGSLSVWP
jgi:hypothetical protein